MPTKRTWTRQEAIENLDDYGRIAAHGGFQKLRSMPLPELTTVLKTEGYENFQLIEGYM